MTPSNTLTGLPQEALGQTGLTGMEWIALAVIVLALALAAFAILATRRKP